MTITLSADEVRQVLDDVEPGGPFIIDHVVLDSTASIVLTDRDTGRIVGSVLCQDCPHPDGVSPLDRISEGDTP